MKRMAIAVLALVVFGLVWVSALAADSTTNFETDPKLVLASGGNLDFSDPEVSDAEATGTFWTNWFYVEAWCNDAFGNIRIEVDGPFTADYTRLTGTPGIYELPTLLRTNYYTEYGPSPWGVRDIEVVNPYPMGNGRGIVGLTFGNHGGYAKFMARLQVTRNGLYDPAGIYQATVTITVPAGW